MAKITIDCADPSDFTAITEAAEKAAGRCNITYAKHAAAMVQTGTVKSERKAAAKIAEETGDNPETVRKMIQRGKAEMGTGVPTPIRRHNGQVCQDEEPEPQRHVIHKGKVYYGARFAEMAIEQLKRIEKEDPQREAALRKVIAWAQNQLDASGVMEDAEESLPPAKAERREKAREVLKPIAEKAITAAIEFGLDKTIHLNDSFSSVFSTGVGSGRVLIAEVIFKKLNGT